MSDPLEAIVRGAIRAGKLPKGPPDRTWGGRGVGAPCTLCERPVTAADIEYQIEFARTDPPGLDKFHVHLRCFAFWELLRTEEG